MNFLFKEIDEHLDSIFTKRNIKYDKNYPASMIKSDHFSFYWHPKEFDYFNEEIKFDYKLLLVDSPVVPSRVPPPYQIPDEFFKLPGKIIYISLGSIFSCYYLKIQKLLDTLATLPYKYIISKGTNGDKIKFPDNRFIGDNYVDQFAVLQVKRHDDSTWRKQHFY